MVIRAVIFDLDGTVASFNLDYRRVRSLVIGYLTGKGVPESLLSLNESVFEMLRKTEAWAKSLGKPDEFIEEVRREALGATEDYELEAAETTTLMLGVIEVLKALREMGLRIGLCTINSERSVNRILERFEIAGMFEVIVTRNHVRHVKPDPEHLEAALKVLGASPAETVVVGDSRVDMQSAKGLGAVAVGLPTGVSTVEQLIEGGANYILTELTNLPLLISRLNAAT